MKNVLFVSPYAVVPPRYGGPLRVYNLCLNLSHYYNVKQFAQQVQRSNISLNLSPLIQKIQPNYIEYSSRNPLNLLLYAVTSLKWNCPPVWQSVVLKISNSSWLREQLNWADIIHVEHPWQFSWIYKQVGNVKPIILSAHNVESILYKPEQILAPRLIACKVIQAIQSQELFAVNRANHVVVTAPEDLQWLIENYAMSPLKSTLVPNGVDCTALVPADSVLKQQRKFELGLSDKKIIVFSGSMHRPNVEAMQQIINWVENWQDDRICFLIVGTVGRIFPHIEHPLIKVTGSVEQTKPFFEAADMAINPMISGSGTNLKQLEFMAMGLPTIATPIGARGIPIIDGVHGYIREIGEFPNQINWLLENLDSQTNICNNGRALVEKQFDWSIITNKLLSVYEKFLK